MAQSTVRTLTSAGAQGVARDLSDEDLVAAVRRGDDHALEVLLDRYRGFARAKSRSYFLVGGDREDIVQEGMIGLYKAVRDFDPDAGAAFRSFAELCITRQILTAIKTATRLKHAPLNKYVSFDKPSGSENDLTVEDAVCVEAEADPLHQLLLGDDVRNLRAVFDEVLSELETRVLSLYVEGRSYQEIAEQLGRHVKSIDNALQRIKRKLESRLRAIQQAS
jgi:RNA polymerase sporulation-specific sigma factor